MATKYTIQVDITSSSDTAAVKQFEQSLTTLNATSAKAQGHIGGLASTIKNQLGGAIAGLVGTGMLVKFLKDGMAAAIDAERSLKLLASTARMYGQDGNAAAAAAQALGDSLQKIGFDDDEVIAATQQLLLITKDYQRALSAASLTADFARARNISYSEALSIVSGLLVGRDKGLIYKMRAFGIEAATTEEAIFKLDQKFRGFAAANQDTKSQLDATKQELNDFGKQIGGPLATALLYVIKGVKTLAQALTASWLAFITAAQGVGAYWRALKGLATEGIPGFKAAWGGYFEQTKLQWQEWAAQLDAVWNVQIEKAKQLAALGRAPLLASHKTGDVGEADRDEYLKGVAERKKLDEQARKDRFARLMKESQDRLRIATAEVDRLAALGNKEVENYLKMLDKKNAATLEADALEREVNQQRIDQEVATLQWSQMNEDQKLQAKLGAMASYSAAAESLFGQSKELAIAQALINAYGLAVGAGKDTEGPVWVRVAAVVAALAAGMAQVQAIRRTNIGGGGGSAAWSSYSAAHSKPTVYRGGTSGGAGTAGSQGMTINRTTNEGGSQVTVNALTGAQAAAALNEFERMRRPAGRTVNRGYATRSATKVGTARAR